MDSWIPSILYLNYRYKELKCVLPLLQGSETFTNPGILLVRWVLLLFWFLIPNTGNIYSKLGYFKGIC